jgi:hypothetical protein
MTRRFFAVLSGLVIVFLVAFVVLNARNPRRSATDAQLNLKSQTRGEESLTAEVVNDQVKIKLKNNHKDTITAFVIRLNDVTVKEDFAYSEVEFGIEPGATLERDYPFPSSTQQSELPTLHLVTVLLRNGASDGNSKVAKEIKDERLGEKIQILRTLKILEREGKSPKNLIRTKNDIVAALDSGEVETRNTLSELEPTLAIENEKLSDNLKAGLQWGRAKMLRRFEVVEKLPTEAREEGFTEFKARSQKLFAKL